MKQKWNITCFYGLFLTNSILHIVGKLTPSSPATSTYCLHINVLLMIFQWFNMSNNILNTAIFWCKTSKFDSDKVPTSQYLFLGSNSTEKLSLSNIFTDIFLFVVLYEQIFLQVTNNCKDACFSLSLQVGIWPTQPYLGIPLTFPPQAKAATRPPRLLEWFLVS